MLCLVDKSTQASIASISSLLDLRSPLAAPLFWRSSKNKEKLNMKHLDFRETMRMIADNLLWGMNYANKRANVVVFQIVKDFAKSF